MRSGLCLLERAATATHRLTGVAAYGTGVGLGTLCANREATFMANTALGADVLQALYVLADLTAKLALDGVALSERTDLLLLVSREVAALTGRLDASLLEDVEGTGRTNAEDKRQRVRELLVVRERYTGDTHGIEELENRILKLAASPDVPCGEGYAY